MRPLIEIKRLAVSFPGSRRPAVGGVDLSIARDGFTALVGPSGCGKTLTALSIAGLAPSGAAVTGEILLYREEDGSVSDLRRLSARGLRAIRGKDVAYVFQDPLASLNPVMRVGDQLAETYLAHFPAPRDVAWRQAVRALGEVRMNEPDTVARLYPHQLSGGMRQRAMIAMALLCQPLLLVADEPTTALDVTTQKEILDALKPYPKRARSLAILFITHDLALAARYADTVYVMDSGTVVERLTRESGFRAAHPHSRRLFSAALASVPPKARIET